MHNEGKEFTILICKELKINIFSGDNSKAVSLSLLSMQMVTYQNKSGKESADLSHFHYSLLLLYMLQSQIMRESLSHSVSQCLSIMVSIHLWITEKAQKTFQKNRSKIKMDIAQNLGNRKPASGEQVSLIAM